VGSRNDGLSSRRRDNRLSGSNRFGNGLGCFNSRLSNRLNSWFSNGLRRRLGSGLNSALSGRLDNGLDNGLGNGLNDCYGCCRLISGRISTSRRGNDDRFSRMLNHC
jgi:hypothetical protein